MAESQGQDSSLFSSQAVIRLSPCVLNNVQAVVVECGPGANSSTCIKEKVVAEAAKDRASLSKSPLPEEMPPPTAEGTPVGPNGGTPLPKRKRGAITPSSQPKGKVARSRSDSALAASSTSQKASHSGRRGGSQTRDLESMVTDCSGSDHDVSARVVLLTTPQDSNPAPPVIGRSVGSFLHAEPGEARDGYQSAQHHNAQRFRSRREGAGTGANAKTAHREERPIFQGKRFFPRKKVTGPPAFVEFPVVLQNVPGPVLFSKLGPWKRTELLSAVCGPVQSIRPIQNGKFLIGCHSEGQQGKLSRCQSLPGGVDIQCRIPVPTVEGVIGPIPLGEWALKQIKADLLADGHRVAGVFRLKNRKGEPSRAVRVTFEGCTLPAEVWIACTPHQVSAFAGSVRRCTKCQVIGHTKSQCRSRVTRCSRCGAGGHVVEGCSNTLSCINCNGRHSAAFRQCPEMLVHARANVLRSSSYIPFSVALQRARVELLGGPVLPEPTGRQNSKPQPDRCWAVDRAAAAANPLTTGTRPAPLYATVAARGVGGRKGGGGGPQGRPAPERGQATKQIVPKPKPGNPVPPGQSLRGLPARRQGGREGVRATAVQGGAPRKKAAEAKFSPEPASANNPKHTTPIASREQLLERAARLRPTFLARQRQRREAEFLKQQEADDSLQQNQHMVELEAIMKRIRKGRDGVPPTPFKTLLWDLFQSMADARRTGRMGPLLNMLNTIIGAASGHRQGPPLSLTKYLDLMLVMSGVKSKLEENHHHLPDYTL